MPRETRASLRARFGAEVADGRYPGPCEVQVRRAWLARRLEYLLAIPKRNSNEDVGLEMASRRVALIEEMFVGVPTTSA